MERRHERLHGQGSGPFGNHADSLKHHIGHHGPPVAERPGSIRHRRSADQPAAGFHQCRAVLRRLSARNFAGIGDVNRVCAARLLRHDDQHVRRAGNRRRSGRGRLRVSGQSGSEGKRTQQKQGESVGRESMGRRSAGRRSVGITSYAVGRSAHCPPSWTKSKTGESSSYALTLGH